MNERNVAALAAIPLRHYTAGEVVGIANLIADYVARRISPGHDAPLPTPEAVARAILPLALDLIAEDLAAAGVLVPSALTDEDADRAIGWAVHPQHEVPPVRPVMFRAELERIAKGEA